MRASVFSRVQRTMRSKHSTSRPAIERQIATPSTSLGYADREGRVVITEDADFVSSRGVAGRPSRRVLISTGHTGSDVLERRLIEHSAVIEQALKERGFVEPAAEGLVVGGS
jgi:predicted nuclease of predicted toxin-antitoxin system